jgi:hypothetical protein
MLGPIELINKRIDSFEIKLYGSSAYFIVIDDIEIETAKYIDGRFEGIYVWERKYIVSEYEDVGGYDIDLNGPDDYLRYDEDLNNSGQYFRMRTDRYDQVVAQDKLRSVACGKWYDNDIPITSLSYDTLHDVEKDEQQQLYKYAIELDPTGDFLTYSYLIPYKVSDFLSDQFVFEIPFTTAIILSEMLQWEKIDRVVRFKQFEYWRPGGHYYTWDPKFKREKCWLFGDVEDFFEGYYVHVDHFGVGTPLEVDPSKPIDPGNSYYSLRFYTQLAKYNRAVILGGGQPEESRGDLVVSANIYNPNIF